MKKIGLILVIISVFVMGCSAHNPFIIKNTTESTKLSKYSPHTKKIFITRESLLTTDDFELISTIEIGKVWYGSSRSIYNAMANKARELGADAVIELKTWHQPSGWSWAAPHGSGKAIKFIDLSNMDLSKIKGKWY